MRKALALATACVSMLAVGAGSASADAEINGHNCAGVVVSTFAGPDFGQIVSEAAHQQMVDNFGLRNCGQANGQNP